MPAVVTDKVWYSRSDYEHPAWIEVTFLNGKVERFEAVGHGYNSGETLKVYDTTDGGCFIVPLASVQLIRQDKIVYK